MIHGGLSDLFDLLRVQRERGDTHIGGHVGGGRSRVYGGQFLGQGLMAALDDTDGAAARSLQSLYLRPGSTDVPLRYTATSMADDFIAVSAFQDEQAKRCLFSMDVRLGEPACAPAIPMPEVPPPQACVSREEGIGNLERNTDSTWAVLDSPFDYRFVENIWAEDFRAPAHHVWFRARDLDGEPCSEPQSLQQAALAYFSDDNIMDNALFPHGWHNCWSNLQTASLDHSVWFHADIDLGSWLLFAQDSPVAAHGRGMTRGLFYRPDGVLVATAYQEILMR